MKKILLFIVLTAFIFGFTTKDTYRVIHQNSFGQGEHVEYLLHYGFVHAGNATIDVSKKLYKVNGRPCYKVDVYGRSIGSLEMVTKIRDYWRSYIDTTSIIPHRFYRNLLEGGYKLKETTKFFPAQKKAVIIDHNGTNQISVYDNIQDMISGYFYIRTLDLERFPNGKIITVPAILEDDLYKLKIKFLGKKEIKTKFGKIDCFVMSPILPKNDLFKGENPMKVYISDDGNRVPVKILAELMVGAVEIDLKSYKNLKHKMAFKK